LDSPFHRYADGADLAALELERLVDLPAEVFHLQGATSRSVTAEELAGRDVRGKAVLLHTGWDSRFGTPAYGEHAPFLAADGVAHLLAAGVTLVGIDSVDLDDTAPEARGERPAHSGFFGAGVPVVEHLTNLGQLPESGARVTVVPPKIEAFGTVPVRAFASVPAPTDGPVALPTGGAGASPGGAGGRGSAGRTTEGDLPIRLLADEVPGRCSLVCPGDLIDRLQPAAPAGFDSGGRSADPGARPGRP